MRIRGLMMGTITMDYLMDHNFEKTGLENEVYNRPNVSGMFSRQEIGKLPKSDEDKLDELKIKMGDLIREKCGGYPGLYVKTNINPSTMKKYLNLKKKRNISREMMAKFVVGLGLSLEEANEMFYLLSHPLDVSTTRLDAVVVHCIENGLDIYGFFDTCEQIHLEVAMSN